MLIFILGLDGDVVQGLEKSKPFLDRIWSTISHFPTTISDRTRLELSGQIFPEVKEVRYFVLDCV